MLRMIVKGYVGKCMKYQEEHVYVLLIWKFGDHKYQKGIVCDLIEIWD